MNEIYGYILIDKQGRIIEYQKDLDELNELLFAKAALSEHEIDSQILSVNQTTYEAIDKAFYNQNPNAIKGYRFAPDLENLVNTMIW